MITLSRCWRQSWAFKVIFRLVLLGWVVGGWVLKMKLILTQLSTKLELKLKLSLAKS